MNFRMLSRAAATTNYLTLKSKGLQKNKNRWRKIINIFSLPIVASFLSPNLSKAVQIDSFYIPNPFQIDYLKNTVDPVYGGALGWRASYTADPINYMNYDGTLNYHPNYQSYGSVETNGTVSTQPDKQIASSASEVTCYASIYGCGSVDALSTVSINWAVDVGSIDAINSQVRVPINIDWLFSILTGGTGKYYVLSDTYGSVSVDWGRLLVHVHQKSNEATDVTYAEHDSIEAAQGSTLLFQLRAQTLCYGVDSFSCYAQASADPVLSIDPNWEYADQVSLTYHMPALQRSGGAGIKDNNYPPSVSVPEPPSIALLSIGLVFIGMGFLLQRKKLRSMSQDQLEICWVLKSV